MKSRKKQSDSASVARDRLMVAITWFRSEDGRLPPRPVDLIQLQDELMAVIRKYLGPASESQSATPLDDVE